MKLPVRIAGLVGEVSNDTQLLEVVRAVLETLVEGDHLSSAVERRTVLPLLETLNQRLEPAQVCRGKS